MNPHFLFNALNSIKNYIIKNKQKKAVLYLTKFAKLIRLVLDNAKKKEITLKEEIELLKIYIAIENMRFNNKIDFHIDISDDIEVGVIKIPPLLFQSFIENAIWHGLAPKKGDKKLYVKIYKETPYLIINIEDNGIGREAAAKITAEKNFRLKKESVGLKIVEERLAVYTSAFHHKYQINFIDLYDEQNKPTGTRVIIKIPIS
jgi:sensor histidine kinase YesM